MAFIFNCVWHFKELVLVLKLHISFLNVNRVGCNLLCQVSASNLFNFSKIFNGFRGRVVHDVRRQNCGFVPSWIPMTSRMKCWDLVRGPYCQESFCNFCETAFQKRAHLEKWILCRIRRSRNPPLAGRIARVWLFLWKCSFCLAGAGYVMGNALWWWVPAVQAGAVYGHAGSRGRWYFP